MAKRDYYDVLGISKAASADEIKKSYRRLAMKHHPDRNTDDSSAESKFKEAKEAYEVLKDTEKRATYDRFGHDGLKTGPGGAGGFSAEGFGDIFGDVFGDIFGGGRQRRSQVFRGADLGYELRLDLERLQVTEIRRGENQGMAGLVAHNELQLRAEHGHTVQLLRVEKAGELVRSGFRLVHDRLDVRTIDDGDKVLRPDAEYAGVILPERLRALGGGRSLGERPSVHPADAPRLLREYAAGGLEKRLHGLGTLGDPGRAKRARLGSRSG